MALARLAQRQGQRLGFAQRQVGPRSSVVARVTHNQFVLTPIGDGATRHIGNEAVPATETVRLKKANGVIEVGRTRPAEVLIPAPTVSSRHAIMRIEDGTLFVTDLNSTNGTSVNGVDLAPMTAAQLKTGDVVIFGDAHLAKFSVEVVETADTYTAALPEDLPAEAVVEETAEKVSEPEPAQA